MGPAAAACKATGYLYPVTLFYSQAVFQVKFAKAIIIPIKIDLPSMSQNKILGSIRIKNTA
jgi:hypothetical protein